MEPPKPDQERKAVERELESEFNEFEQLLSARFEVDPSLPITRSESAKKAARTRRLRQLGRLLEQR